jgi:hypothetical protein
MSADVTGGKYTIESCRPGGFGAGVEGVIAMIISALRASFISTPSPTTPSGGAALRLCASAKRSAGDDAAVSRHKWVKGALHARDRLRFRQSGSSSRR